MFIENYHALGSRPAKLPDSGSVIDFLSFPAASTTGQYRRA
jgi:hypothetical protein